RTRRAAPRPQPPRALPYRRRRRRTRCRSCAGGARDRSRAHRLRRRLRRDHLEAAPHSVAVLPRGRSRARAPRRVPASASSPRPADRRSESPAAPRRPPGPARSCPPAAGGRRPRRPSRAARPSGCSVTLRAATTSNAISYDRPVRALVVGSGGREHALVWSLSRDGGVDELHAAPGNPGIAALAHCHPIRADDQAALVSLARELRIDLVVVGPEAPLVAGLADELRHRGIAVFGPSAAAAQIEGSKAFAKEVMEAAGVPTARTLPVARPPCVVKLDGLAAGKGVWVCRTQDELDSALKAAESLGQPFHVEELLEGQEVSVFALSDGAATLALPAAQDYKRAEDDDAGPNTGGMGSYSPVARLSHDDASALVELTCAPIVAELASRGTPFQGALFAGLMLTPDG